MQKLRVGVLMGGKSIEHEVSFNSGRTICDHLDTERFEVIPLYQERDGTLYFLPWHFLHRGKTTDFEHRLKGEAESLNYDDLKSAIDFMYIATHGRYAEDGTLQGMLEVLDIPYLGAKMYGSALGMDKAIQRSVLQANGIEIPKGFIAYPSETDNLSLIKEKFAAAQLSYPVIIKPHMEGSSLGMSVVFKEEDLLDGIQKATYACPGKAQAVIVEEKLDGMEFSAIILTDYKNNKLMPLPITEIVLEEKSHFFDYDQKYMPGRARKFTPARCSDEDTTRIQTIVAKTMEILEFTNLTRTDGFLTKDGRVVIIDPNSLSGMGPSTFLFNQAAHVGMGHTELINHLINTELESYGMLNAVNNAQKIDTSSEKKQRIAVLFGGQSHEREISLESGRNICYKLSPQKYEVIPIFVNKNFKLYTINHEQLILHATIEIEERLTPDQKIKWHDLKDICDFVFIGLHGGKGENGSVQGMLEMMGMPYNGSSVLASALSMNKVKTAEFLKHNGFETPHSQLLRKKEWQKTSINTLQELRFPLIAKPSSDGCSVGVVKIKNESQLNEQLSDLFLIHNELMLEEYITGMELTVGVVGNEKPYALPPSQAVVADGILSIEEKFLPGAGENQTPAPLPQHALDLVKKTMESVYQAVGLKGYARIDCFYQTAQESPTGKERVIILEINSLPGMTPATCIFHQAAELGIKPMEFVDMIVQLGMQEHKNVDLEKSIETFFKKDLQEKSVG